MIYFLFRKTSHWLPKKVAPIIFQNENQVNKEYSLSIGFLKNRLGLVELVITFVGFSAGILDLKEVFSIALA